MYSDLQHIYLYIYVSKKTQVVIKDIYSECLMVSVLPNIWIWSQVMAVGQ